MDENKLSYHIISAAIEVHKTPGGPGLLESVYEEALVWELSGREFEVQTLTYLRLIGLKLGLVINLGETYVKNGIHRVVNGL